MKQIVYTQHQRNLLAQFSLPTRCVHNVYGTGLVTKILIPEGLLDIILICKFKNGSMLGFLYSKVTPVKLKLAQSVYSLLDQLLATLPDELPVSQRKPSVAISDPVFNAKTATLIESPQEAGVEAIYTEKKKSIRKSKVKHTSEGKIDFVNESAATIVPVEEIIVPEVEETLVVSSLDFPEVHLESNTLDNTIESYAAVSENVIFVGSEDLDVEDAN